MTNILIRCNADGLVVDTLVALIGGNADQRFHAVHTVHLVAVNFLTVRLIPQLDGDRRGVIHVLLVVEIHLNRIGADGILHEYRLARADVSISGVNLHRVARNGGSREVQCEANGRLRVALRIGAQLLSAMVAAVRIFHHFDDHIAGFRLVFPRYGDSVLTVETVGRAVIFRRGDTSLLDNLIASQLGRVRPIRADGVALNDTRTVPRRQLMPLRVHRAVEHRGAGERVVECHFFRLIFAGNRILRRRYGLGGPICLIARNRGRKDGALHVALDFGGLRGEVREVHRVAWPRAELGVDLHLNHVPLVLEHHDRIALEQADLIACDVACVCRDRQISSGPVGEGTCLILRFRSESGFHAGHLPLRPRPAVHALGGLSVLAAALRRVGPQRRLRAAVFAHADYIDDGIDSLGGIALLRDDDVLAHVAHGYRHLAVAQRGAELFVILGDDNLRLALAVLFIRDIHRFHTRHGVSGLFHVICRWICFVRCVGLDLDCLALEFKAGRRGEMLCKIMTVVGMRAGIIVLVLSNDVIAQSRVIHHIFAKVDDLAIVFCGVGDHFVAGVRDRKGIPLTDCFNAGGAVVCLGDGAGRVVGIEGIFLVRLDRNAAGDLRSGLVHRAAQRQDIIRVLGRDGDRAGFITQVDLAGLGDVQIDTGSVGVDGAADVGAVRLISEGGLFKQQLVAGGGESGALAAFRQQGDGVGFHCLLQRRVGGAVISGHSSSSSSSSLPLIKLRVGVHARCGRDAAGNCVFYKVLYEVSARIRAVTVTIVEYVNIADNCQRAPPRAIAVTGILVAYHIADIALICLSCYKRIDL